MGYKEITLKMPTNFSSEDLKLKIKKITNLKDFKYSIITKSLDARNKSKIHWFLKIGIYSESIKNGSTEEIEELIIPYKRTNKKAIVIGSGPAGFFSAYVLQLSGIHTYIIERGYDVDKRSKAIEKFHQDSIFNEKANYAFGEGGAGTFSDGKLTSRSKRISKEKNFILSSYIKAGAPEEIKYMTHPHLGSDNLKKIVKNLRKEFESLGGNYLFETTFVDMVSKNNKIQSILTNNSLIDADYFIMATGHSAYETYKTLIKNNVIFKPKNFAIGFRAEHYQSVINLAQWGIEKLDGVKAAEYRLTSKTQNGLSVYSFCMCPGGIIVPSTAYKNNNIVNGMSNYLRNGKFANAAIVSSVNLERLLSKELSALESLKWLDDYEKKFYKLTKNYAAPYCSISEFISKKINNTHSETSYPMGLNKYDLWNTLPKPIIDSITEGLTIFNKKLKGFETGNLIGLESKTSAPIQVLRNDDLSSINYENLYVVGEGSGYAGGIISSAADGIKAAINIIKKEFN